MANNTRQNTLLALLRQSPKPLALPELARFLQPPPAERTLRRWLAAWVADGVLIRSGKGRATRYHVSEPESQAYAAFAFLQGLDTDLRQSVLNQIRDLWSHTSTALEGNTLSLGDTHFLLEQGLTISGKPLKDHQEVIGHARAIELIYASLGNDLSTSIIFDLHKAIQTTQVTDIYKPMGAWKVEVNGTYALDHNEQQVFIEYAAPGHVPALMAELVDFINGLVPTSMTLDNAHLYYARVHMGIAHIHPFWDGNGRIARLLANIPLLKAGLPPLLINHKNRREYIQALSAYQIVVGPLTAARGVWPDLSQLANFERFCHSHYGQTRDLVARAFALQSDRKVMNK